MYNPSKHTIKRRQRTAVPQFLLDYFSEDVPISGLNYIPTENPSVPEVEFSSPCLKYTYTRKKRARTMAVAPVETPSKNIAASQTDLDVKIDFDTYEATSGTFEIVFCGYKFIPEQLVEMGMLPASLNNVQYAIHFRLLEFMRDMRDVLATSGQGLANLCNKINLDAKISKAYCQNLLHVFIRLTMIVEAKVEKLLPGFWESNCCPACPDVDSNVAIDDCQYVAMDGNFSLKCERRKDGEGDVGKELEQVGRFDSNFHAGSGSLAKSIKYPIKGLFAASCARHKSVIKLVDMETGEGFKYSLFIINQLLGDSGSDGQSADSSPNINVMYDVVCKLAKSLKANFLRLMEKSKLAVPIFHMYAHVQHCQIKLNPKYRDEFGLTDGECLERLWLYLNHFVTMTRKMGQANRKLVLYRAIKFHNETKKIELGLMLESKYVKAKRIIEESRKALEGFDCVVIEREWKQHVNKVEKLENYVDIADLMESGRKVQGNIALSLINFTILRRLRELANDANGNHVKDEINRLKHEMEKLKAKIQEEVEGFQEPDEENTNLIKYIEENAQLGIFWDAKIRPKVHLFLVKKRAEEVALLKRDAFWLQHRITKERTLREQGLKALDNAVGTLDKEVLCGMQFLLARKLRLSMSWERAVFAQTSFLLESLSSPSSVPFASSSSVPFASSSSVPFASSSSVSSSSLIVEDINPSDDGEASIAFVVEAFTKSISN
ncbi:hypothetical protein PHYBLDRAFT_64441 [Phycomyces blakesleeanus NRRL 1555(-)]|uniref:CxC1-like cysteine cluster associated with KDZ transposases domain-containing protein n=1 Tax=Phycomyces blakesleeanus (strain ATCC 8743b / DSM 1359 / FGSC 10004 / NBRC 33097 / NRRL 1555) TaxID=763407 RepID=A0A162NMA5_PHYB8|nr:hypothetical protein PHYBLDRAFT_64441 [Phycomyces blakesleeanus NRRL 1555(-)]OAD75528.1 hypothetical protein PHYBLDRAFT_64441 [Phycomyces blakesleeanus NRRL 1555(-)]|eukprot:XP_018293568.1 hypothetical protein PHYBLDRAFT_64441 [Phycomyces blakesleeanus NRRL 1555(-)]